MTREHREAILGGLRCRRLLDLASGSGDFILSLVEAGAALEGIVAVDIDHRWLDEGRGRPRGRTVHRLVADGRRLPFTQASFDGVSIANGLHHFDDPAAVLREARRVLTPGGRLLIDEISSSGLTPAQANRHAYHTLSAELDRATGGVHHPALTDAEITDLVETAGFSIQHGFSHTPLFEGDYTAHITLRLNRIEERIRDAALDDARRADFLRRLTELHRSIRRRGVQPQPQFICLARSG